MQEYIKKILGSGHNRILVIPNDEMKDILITVRSLEDSRLLLKGDSARVKNEIKEQREVFLRMLLGTLGASLLGNMFANKGVIRAGEGVIKAGEETTRVGYKSRKSSLKDLRSKKNF